MSCLAEGLSETQCIFPIRTSSGLANHCLPLYAPCYSLIVVEMSAA